ncbi:MAG: hypothetical protein A2511_15050 [Deltaproteobacteria bacterium RIFOXYD12_FULL_50_9]|nr:MAG: hypothetical protein A2511_15050 [Deltaproteobacteria bacterium RIFOXYD12_FULL_50_9]
MKRIAVFFLIPLLLCLATPGFAKDEGGITIIISSRIRPYMQALQGFREACADIHANLAQKAIQTCSLNEIYLPEGYFNPADFVEKIRSDHPFLLLAIGTNALETLKGITDIPIIFVLVPNPEKIITGHTNMTGITLQVPLEKELDTLLNALPATKRIGLIYNKTTYLNQIQRLEAHAQKKAISILARQADNARQVPKLVSEMAGLIDALWILPDTTLITGETLDHMLLFSLENRVPILSFSEKHLQSGAALAISFDVQDIGRQAGIIAKKIHEKTHITEVPIETPRRLKIMINRSVLTKLGIILNHETKYFEE